MSSRLRLVNFVKDCLAASTVGTMLSLIGGAISFSGLGLILFLVGRDLLTPAPSGYVPAQGHSPANFGVIIILVGLAFVTIGGLFIGYSEESPF